MPRYGTVDFDYASRLAACDPVDDGPIYMLNLMKYRARADYGTESEGREASGREADDRYLPVEVLASIGASPCFLADVIEASEDWDRVGVVCYPTRRSFIEMQSRKDFQDKHVHKEAGMDHTIVMGTLPGAARELPTSARATKGRVVLEVWRGTTPPPPGRAPSASFTVEGTIVGDGRAWDGARYTTVSGDAPVLPAGRDDYQTMILAPTFERWS